MKGFDEVLVIDEIGLWQLDEDRKFRLRRINWSLNLACLFTSRRIWLAKRMEKFYKRLANEIQCDLFIVNHPLVRAWSPTANTLVDIIDNFAKHVRYSTPEKQLFGENIAAANKGGYAFLVVTNEAAKALGLRRFGWLDNLPLTNCRPESIAVRSGLVCVGFFSERVDWEVIRAVAARGIQVDLYGKFFDGVEKEIQDVPGVVYRGFLNDEDKPSVMAKYRAMLIPYLGQTEHDGSPAKAYDALACGLPVISTLDYAIDNINFHYARDAKSLVDVLAKVQWDDSARITEFGDRVLELISELVPG